MRLSGKRLKCTNKDCRKEVIVPDEDLREGKLSCRECGLIYNVCNKEVERQGRTQKQAEGGQEESPFAQWNREYDFKTQQQKLQKLQLKEEAELAQAA